MANYLIYPGYGRTAQGEDVTYIDAPSLAALYGLDPGEYVVADASAFRGTEDSLSYINLHPREDGLYRDIKTELGDNGMDYHWDRVVNADKHRKKGRRQYDINGGGARQ